MKRNNQMKDKLFPTNVTLGLELTDKDGKLAIVAPDGILLNMKEAKRVDEKPDMYMFTFDTKLSKDLREESEVTVILSGEEMDKWVQLYGLVKKASVNRS